jgi:hypothetical protein
MTKRDKVIKQAKANMSRIGQDLVRDIKANISTKATGNGFVEKGDMQARDLLSLLIRANMSTDLPEDQRLSDEDVIARTFFVPYWA